MPNALWVEWDEYTMIRRVMEWAQCTKGEVSKIFEVL